MQMAKLTMSAVLRFLFIFLIPLVPCRAQLLIVIIILTRQSYIFFKKCKNNCEGNAIFAADTSSNMNITEKDKTFMREAIRLANESVKNGGGPFGAVIVKDGEIVAGSSNSVTRDNDPTAHAEVNTIRQA